MLAHYVPSVFIGGQLQTNLQSYPHSDCAIVYLIPISNRDNGQEISVQYGTSHVGRWSDTIHVCELQSVQQQCVCYSLQVVCILTVSISL